MSMLFFLKPFVRLDPALPELYIQPEKPKRKKKRRKVYKVKKEGRKAVTAEIDTDKQARWLINRQLAEERKEQRRVKQQADLAHILTLLDFFDDEDDFYVH